MRTRRSAICLVLLIAIGAGRTAEAGEEPRQYQGRDAASWASDLASENLDTRRKAAFALWQVETDARPHVRALAKALRDDDEYVRSTAEKVLLRFEWQQSPNTLTTALPELIDALGDKRATVRLAAASLIWSAGPIPNVVGGDPPPKTLLPALVAALQDEDAGVRANAAASLGTMQKGAATAFPALEKALRDEDPGVRLWIVQALSWIDAKKGMAAILKLADDEDPDVRAAVLGAAGGATSEMADAALDRLLVGVRDKTQSVRTAAVSGLAALGSAEALPTLVSVLKKDAEPSVRGAAARALGTLGDPAAAAPLLAALSRTDDATRIGAVAGLARLGPEGTIGLPRLIELLKTGSAPLRSRIASELFMFGPLAEPALPALVANLQHESVGVRSAAASMLFGLANYGIRNEAMRSALVVALADDETQVRQYAASGIAALGPYAHGAVPGLLTLYARPDGQVVPRAIFYALQKIGPAAKQALPMLRKAVAEPGPDRLAAATALACVAEDANEIDGALRILNEALADEKRRTRALIRIKHVGPRARDAAPNVRVWMKPDSRWKLAAAGALLRIEGGNAADAIAVLATALGGDAPGLALGQLTDIGPEGRGLIPALLAHAKDPASSWRTGALTALIRIHARGTEVREAYTAARKAGDGWTRTLGARGLAQWEK